MTEFDWISQCEAEPLAHSGAIQPHGGLIYLDEKLRVSHVSSNIENFLSYSPKSLLEQSLPEKLDKKLGHTIAALSEKPGSRIELYAVSIENSPSIDIVLTRGNYSIILEFFPHIESATFF